MTNFIQTHLTSPQIKKAVQELDQQAILPRIWAKDYTVWHETPTEISNRLGWLDAVQTMTPKLAELNQFGQTVRAAGYTHVLLLGMGGSSLAPELFYLTFGVAPGHLHLTIVDTTDPTAIFAHTQNYHPAGTLCIVATKSGGTVETLSAFKYFYNWIADAVGVERAGDHFVAITDPGSSLVRLAEQYHFRAVFLNDPNIGGRYSALSYFGLLPASLLGVNLALLLKRAEGMMENSRLPIADNVPAWIAAAIAERAKLGRDKLTFILSPALASFGDWVEQLIAESTGKDGQGILPVVGEPMGEAAVYGPDRHFVYLQLAGDSTYDSVVMALMEAGHPVIHLLWQDLYDLGGQFFLWEMVTAIVGHRLGIQPFDQPNVESAKVLAREMVKMYQETGQLPALTSAPLTTDALQSFLAQARPGDYMAIQAYVTPSAEMSQALQQFRQMLRDQTGLATTVGYGPRFLHSTGQLHKGDAGNGLFIQLTAESSFDLPIPDRAGEKNAGMSFGVLLLSQAIGDFAALLAATPPRRAIRFHLAENKWASLRLLMGD